jgi:hypothetical protein
MLGQEIWEELAGAGKTSTLLTVSRPTCTTCRILTNAHRTRVLDSLGFVRCQLVDGSCRNYPLTPLFGNRTDEVEVGVVVKNIPPPFRISIG